MMNKRLPGLYKAPLLPEYYTSLAIRLWSSALYKYDILYHTLYIYTLMLRLPGRPNIGCVSMIVVYALRKIQRQYFLPQPSVSTMCQAKHHEGLNRLRK